MLSKYDTDLGTPASPCDEHVHLTIDGRPITAAAGTTVMRAAAEAGIAIPRLCATEELTTFGSCRLCVVEIEGRNGYPASCTTPVADGMRVVTESETLARLRRGVMELYISDHPLECHTCASNGHCELQTMAGRVGLREVRYGDGVANHHDDGTVDTSNPYFRYEPGKCIVCHRCVRACDEVQGTFALAAQGRGFDTRIVAGMAESFLDSECISCGACVRACPTATLVEKDIHEHGQPDRWVKTTCAYCGVGCGLTAEVKGERVVRMVPDRDAPANRGHACVKGRFAWSYATHPERVRTPRIRESIDAPWREVGWDEALAFAAERLGGIRDRHGPAAVGAITSSRCTNEETYLVQKLARAALGNNNVDNCARVCHAPTGYGLKRSFGTSAGTQDFDSVAHADVVVLIGANPTEAHPVFGARLKRRLREGARLVVIDPRATELVRAAHVKADYHVGLRPGTNVAVLNALAHVIVTEGLSDDAFIRDRCDTESFEKWRAFVADPQHAPEAVAEETGVEAAILRGAARLYAGGGNAAIYYGLGVTEHSQGSTAVMAIANLAMATGNLGREGVGVNPLRGQNNVQGACDMGAFPHELPGYRHVGDEATRQAFEEAWGVRLDPEPGLRIPHMFDAAVAGRLRGIYVQGEDIAQTDPNSDHVHAALRAMECVVVQDIFENETTRFAHVLLPGSSFLEKDGTFTNAERRISRVRQVMEPLAGKADWQVTCDLATALGYPMAYGHPGEVMDEIARLTPAFQGVSYDRLEARGSLQWPCDEARPEGTRVMHVDGFAGGAGRFELTAYVPSSARPGTNYPLLLTTGRSLPHYNAGTQTRRTGNTAWQDRDLLEIHPDDAAPRGIGDGDCVALRSRSGATTLTARLSERVQPGVVYTSFHFPETRTNALITECSDWATDCPEYKVTAVEVTAEGTARESVG